MRRLPGRLAGACARPSPVANGREAGQTPAPPSPTRFPAGLPCSAPAAPALSGQPGWVRWERAAEPVREHLRLSHDSWTHKLARVAIRPLLGTFVTPDHLTWARLLTGLAACAALAAGTATAGDWGAWWGGGLWLLSAFLDRADGELARVGNMMSEAGHRFDYLVDNAVNALFFPAAGIGLRHSWLGGWAIALGVLAGVSLLVCGWFSERLEQASPPGTRAYSGRWGFDPDDALYLLGPFAWLGWLPPVVIGAAIGATGMMLLTGVRLRRRLLLVRRQRA